MPFVLDPELTYTSLQDDMTGSNVTDLFFAFPSKQRNKGKNYGCPDYLIGFILVK